MSLTLQDQFRTPNVFASAPSMPSLVPGLFPLTGTPTGTVTARASTLAVAPTAPGFLLRHHKHTPVFQFSF